MEVVLLGVADYQQEPYGVNDSYIWSVGFSLSQKKGQTTVFSGLLLIGKTYALWSGSCQSAWPGIFREDPSASHPPEHPGEASRRS